MENQSTRNDKHAIAVVGMSIRAPGDGEQLSLDLDGYWNLLYNRKSATSRVPDDRWNAEAFHGTGPGKVITKEGCFIRDTNRWDPQEFGITAKEAAQVNHGQGVLLHVAHDALQDSGIDYRGKPVGVYTGSGQFARGWEEDITTCREYYTTGNFSSITANRLSYVFDLTGPSMPVDTACSASLTAMHLAVQAIRTGDCDTAIVAGINFTLSPLDTAAFSQLGVLSPTGQSRSFDADANGYSRGDVVAAVVLKRYDLAKRDGDRVRSVLLGSALTCCGSLMGSITTPSAIAQKAAIAQAYKDAGLSPSDADFVELHGTGTIVGDTVEANAAGEIFSQGRNGERILIGSVKSNVGHGELGAYMSSLIKCTMMLEKGIILPNGYFKKPSPRINWEQHNLAVPTTPMAFLRKNKDYALLSISSFGFGGAGGHTVFRSEDLRPAGDFVLDEAPYLFVAGGLTPKAAASLAETYATDYRDSPSAVSELMGRRARQMTWRTFIVGDSIAASSFPEAQMVQMKRQGPLCMLFSGQGPQHAAMGRDLFRRFRVFRDSILECDRMHAEYAGQSLIAATGLFTGTPAADSPIQAAIWPARVISSAIAFFQIALFDLMRSLGFEPDVIVGHSIGESAVLYASGAMTKEAVVQIAAARGRALEIVDGVGGAMAALTCSPEEAEELIVAVEHMAGKGEKLHIAARNSPGNVGISGPSGLIDHLINFSKKWHRGIRAAKLRVSTAVHSPFVDPCEQQYRSDLAAIFSAHPGPHKPVLPVISTVTGDYMTGEYTADYLWRNMRQPVSFTEAITLLAADFADVSCLEFSPHPVLGPYVAEMGVERVFGLVSRPKGPTTEVHGFLQNLGEITVSGINCLNFGKLNGDPYERHALKAPAYPFQYNLKLHWADAVPGYYQRLLPAAPPLNQSRLRISPELPGRWLGDHVIGKSNIVPASLYLEIGLEFPGVTEAYDLKFISAFALDDVNLSVSTLKVEKQGNSFEIRSSTELLQSANGLGTLSTADTEWTRDLDPPFNNLHSSGKLAYGPPDLTGIPKNIDIADFMSRCDAGCLGTDFYDGNIEALQFGPTFRRLTTMHWNTQNPHEILAYFRGTEDLETNFQFHPALSDAMIQCSVASFDAMTDNVAPAIMLPHSVERCFRNDGSREPLVLKDKLCPVVSRMIDWSPEYILVDIFLLAENGDVIFSMIGFRIRRVRRNSKLAVNERYTIGWQPQDLPADKTAVLDLSGDIPVAAGVPEPLSFLDGLAATHIKRFLENTNLVEAELPEEGRRYLEWLRKSAKSPVALSLEELEKFQTAYPTLCEFAQVIADNQENVVLGHRKEIQQLLSQEQMSAFYRIAPFTDVAYDGLVAEVMRLVKAAHENGKCVVRVLEVNSGAGTLTEALGKAFLEADIHVDYCCTDRLIETASAAATRSAWTHITPAALDLDLDVAEQDVPPADIVVGLNLLLSGETMESVVGNLRKLLVPGGSIAVMESCGAKGANGSVWLDFAGSWRQGRLLSTAKATIDIADKDAWRQTLTNTGFSVSSILDSDNSAEMAPLIMVARLLSDTASFPVVFPVTPPSEKVNSHDKVRLPSDSEFSKFPGEEGKIEAPISPITPPTEISALASDHSFHHFEFGDETDLVNFVNSLDDQAFNVVWLHTSITKVNNSSLIGIARTMRHEYPLWSIHVVEFLADWDEDKQRAFILHKLVNMPLTEHEIRVTPEGKLEVSRLVKMKDSGPKQLANGKPVGFSKERDAWAYFPPAVGTDDVEVSVEAVKVSGSKSGLVEFSGVVIARGPGAEIPLGARVFGLMFGGPLSSVIVCSSEHVARIPEGYSFEEAANIIGPLFKCSYTLDLISRVHRLSSSKHAVIHVSDTDPLWPMTLARIFKSQGWRIFVAFHGDAETTVGAAAAEVADMVHAYDDSHRFVAEVNKWTSNVGADYIFSADVFDSGFLNANMEALNEKFGTIAVTGEWEAPPRTVGSQRVVHLTPGLEVRDFPSAVPTAVKEFEHFKHLDPTALPVVPFAQFVDKTQTVPRNVVVKVGYLPQDLSVYRPGILDGTPSFNPRAAYVLVGGVGGLGVALAQFIIHNGGRRVVITSRSGMEGFNGRLVREGWMLEKLRKTPGVQVDVVAVDATDVVAMRSMFQAIDVPIAGVTYLAVRLADSLFSKLTPEMWDQVYDVKVGGLQVLQDALDVSKLDWLVFCSSMATVFGSPGQTNYSGAQAIMERVAEGIPNCVAITVPPIIDGGILIRSMPTKTRNAALSKYTAFGMLAQGVCENILDAIRLIGKTSLHVPAMDWDMVTSNMLAPGGNEMIRHLLNYSGSADSVAAQAGPTGIVTLCAAVLSMEVGDIEMNVPLASYGLDSLTSVRLSTSLKKDLGLEITQLQLLSGNCTVARLQEMLEEEEAAHAAVGNEDAEENVNVVAAEGSPAGGISEDEMGKTVARLNHVTEGRPVFFCHGAGGGILVLQKLAQALPFPVFGIQDTPDAPLQEKHIENLSKFYLEKLLEVQSAGPYRLAGFSFGTAVASELTDMLIARGEVVENVAFLDGSPLALYSDDFGKYLSKQTITGSIKDFIMAAIEDMSSCGALDESQDVPKQFEEYFAGKADVAWIDRFVVAYRSHVQMAFRAGMEVRTGRKTLAFEKWNSTKVFVAKAARGTASEPWVKTGAESLYMDELANLTVETFDTTHFGILAKTSGLAEKLESFFGQ